MKNVMKTIRPKIFLKIVSLVYLMLLAACAPAMPPTIVPTVIPLATATHQTTTREAQVQRIEVQTLQSNPLQISAIVRGNLTESCAILGESQVQYASNTFQITVYVNSLADIGCVQATTPF